MVRPFFASIPSLRTRGIQPVHGEEVDPGSRALEQLQFFSSEKIFLFDLFRRLAPFCRSAQLACLKAGRVIGSWSGHTPSVGQVIPRTFRARETCCWSGSYSILHCRNVNVLPKKMTVRDSDDSGPKVTTLLSSFAPCNRLPACSRPSRRPTMKKSSPCTRM